MIGSERGFCGKFNNLVITKWSDALKEFMVKDPVTIFVGHKLYSKIPEDAKNIRRLSCINAAEEIQSVIQNLLTELETIHKESKEKINLFDWAVIYNEEVEDTVKATIYFPFNKFKITKEKVKFAYPPQLYLTPSEFTLDLFSQYMFADLFKIFSKSFIVENQERLKHMEGALDWLDKKQNELTLYFNSLRQEEITEEIEVILLSVENLIKEI